MSNEILMLPPQVTVGQQVIQVIAIERPTGALYVGLRPEGMKVNEAPQSQTAANEFVVTELHTVLAWIEQEAAKIGEAMQKAEKSRLRRAGYNV